jgi:putative Mg2+ transporter-C (MgtC) family protein
MPIDTHMLTALAAATFTIVALELALWAPGHNATGDPIRAIEAVTAGVAFLAAGTIIQAKTQVIGLTTGASMWLAGALGVACGTGMYALGRHGHGSEHRHSDRDRQALQRTLILPF